MHQKTMTKRLMTMLVAISVLIFTLPSFSAIVHAAGDSNMDGGGGFGGAVDGYTWSSGRDGVRATIVRSADRTVMSSSIDYSNNANTDVIRHFGKTDRIGPLSGT